MPYYYFDWTYVVIVLPCVLLSLWASANVNSTFRKYSQQYSSRRLTGAEAAQRVLSANGVYGVRIERISGNLTDHYDPRANVIRLSDSVYAIIPVTNIGSKLAMPLILIGLLLSYAADVSYFFVYLGIACFGLSLVFQLVTLPVEFNASHRALVAIDEGGLLTEEEQKGAKKTLTAAALTYVAATATALAQLLRLLVIFGGNGRRRSD